MPIYNSNASIGHFISDLFGISKSQAAGIQHKSFQMFPVQNHILSFVYSSFSSSKNSILMSQQKQAFAKKKYAIYQRMAEIITFHSNISFVHKVSHATSFCPPKNM